ncbi:hypothetical protein FZO89_00905 [Luteimonas viscosa]|uniref:Lysozyme inhibitor LprI N-terminal domain-containing protein n=1 Tax=Luteimonas viscosa TaxID=1132694 RepID=A0A5D4XLE0_9GAMM|nr:hypothetical protein [Luteimonas viscosa]TYT24954.1 hypothetical protein FZO89_00905 [Luteimonas viscosa]
MTRVLFLLTLLVAPLLAWSQDCSLPKQAASYEVLFAQYQQQHCFGESADSSDVKRRMDEAIASMKGAVITADDSLALRLQAARALTDLSSSLLEQQDVANDDWRQRLTYVRQRLEQAAAETVVAERDIRAGDWKVDDLTIFDGSYSVVEPLMQDCAKGYTSACQQAQRSAADILRHATLANAVLGRLVQLVRLVPKYEDLKVLDDQWSYYWERGRSQYPWELWVNQRRFLRDHPDPNQFVGPPTSQIILLHLDAAMEYAKSHSGMGSELNAIALVEVIGYNRLSYAADGSSGRSFGGSIITTVSPESGGKRFGWGAMMHFTDRISLGVARRDLGRGEGETTWLLSADVGKLLNLTPEEEQKAFRAAVGRCNDPVISCSGATL